MGQYASEPVVTKDTHELHNTQMVVGTSSMQGWRLSMEDSRTCLLSIPEDPQSSFFAIFDGHGGAQIAEYASKHLMSKIVHRPEYAAGDVEEAIKQAYLDIDNDMSKDHTFKDEVAGSTAISILIKENKCYCGNVGDSRAMISVNGLCVNLSRDHKPADKEESRRIICAGGWVSFDRVKGILAMSRALGDFPFKTNTALPPEQQMLIAYPEVMVADVTADTEFVLLACDGIWDVMSNQEAVDFVTSKVVEQQLRPQQICEDLMTHCLAPDTSSGNVGLDNMTVILVALLQPDPQSPAMSYSQWCTRLKVKRNNRKTQITSAPSNSTSLPTDNDIQAHEERGGKLGLEKVEESQPLSPHTHNETSSSISNSEMLAQDPPSTDKFASNLIHDIITSEQDHKTRETQSFL